ncbi:MAG: hypothetical protein IKV41_05760 [Oscillospiraceae bacterium]|nr:hypothetical protein [Oscillospiraceae bacterium]
MTRQKIYDLINAERDRQNELHPENKHTPMEWAAILSEECGEAVRELNRLQDNEAGADINKAIAELIQTAAVCVRILEGG